MKSLFIIDIRKGELVGTRVNLLTHDDLKGALPTIGLTGYDLYMRTRDFSEGQQDATEMLQPLNDLRFMELFHLQLGISVRRSSGQEIIPTCLAKVVACSPDATTVSKDNDLPKNQLRPLVGDRGAEDTINRSRRANVKDENEDKEEQKAEDDWNPELILAPYNDKPSRFW